MNVKTKLNKIFTIKKNYTEYKDFCYLVSISYDGSSYYGFAKQKNRIKTIQEKIEKSLKELFVQDIKIKYSSRTDKKVHAYDHLFTFSVNAKMLISELVIRKILNENFPSSIYANWVKVQNNNFNIKKQVYKKTYMYKIKLNSNSVFLSRYYWQIPKYNLKYLTNEKLQEIKKYYIGKKNFFHYFNKRLKSNNISYIREIYDIKIIYKGLYITFLITGNGFGRNMVRMIVGTIIGYIQNRININQIVMSLNGKIENNIDNLIKAPPNGLYLYKTYFKVNKNEQKNN